ncbi:putative endonuclease [Flavobacterium fontis]|uniref:Putative endonuclease n=1 Tax=Flavobacterium fontis TaxID=1124188 RepID=A0A1M4WVY6_9FLAO|nr:GIY-YIG nuclease family protein [Flavobacterium fontis]SHE85396.1 putative endonuclease [Flavobacterium fontis]
MYTVYILFSPTLDVYYKGFTSNIELRIDYHLNSKSPYTSKTNDWILVYERKFEIKREALIEEKRLKKLNRKSILDLIDKYKV